MARVHARIRHGVRRGAVALAAVGAVAAGVAFSSGTATAAANAVVFISNPSHAYESATCVVKVGQFADGTPLTSIHTCGETFSFSPTVTKGSVRPGGSWATWGSPPFTEGPTPGLIESLGSTHLTITLSKAKRITGMEMEPEHFGLNRITAQFMHGTSVVATVSRSVEGDAGARLFAIATSPPTQTVNKIVITTTDPGGFAIAKLRVG
jgi:hypothetical protein